MSNKDTHDLVITGFTPSYCKDCNLSGSQLHDVPCIVGEIKAELLAQERVIEDSNGKETTN